MLGTLTSFFLGGVCISDSIKNVSKAVEGKKEALDKGEAYYYDGAGKMRATGSGNICSLNSHSGRTLLKDITTGTVVKDYTAEAIQRANKKLADEGRSLVWKQYKEEFTGNPIWYLFDTTKKMPVTLKIGKGSVPPYSSCLFYHRVDDDGRVSEVFGEFEWLTKDRERELKWVIPTKAVKCDYFNR